MIGSVIWRIKCLTWPINGKAGVMIMSDEFMTVEKCDEKHKQTMKVLNEINDRLFKDNGNLSMQTRLDRSTQTLSIVSWAVAVLCSAIVLKLVGEIVERFLT